MQKLWKHQPFITLKTASSYAALTWTVINVC